MKKRKNRLLVRATNLVAHHRCEPFVAVCQELFRKDLDELYVERISQDKENLEASGLGLLLIRKDYTSRLSFDLTKSLEASGKTFEKAAFPEVDLKKFVR